MSASLSIFDLVLLSEGHTPGQAVNASLSLAQRAEQFGYHRLWYGEHHLNAGVIGYSPAVMMALAGARTSRLRVGSGAVLAGQRTALSVAEDFALLSAALGDRVDLGVGRAATRRQQNNHSAKNAGGRPPAVPSSAAAKDRTTAEGLLLPAAPDLSALRESPRMAAAAGLLMPEGTSPAPYGRYVDDLVAFYSRSAEVAGLPLPDTTPPLPQTPQLWVLGSSAGESAEVAGTRGLRFGANYHVAPSNVTDAVAHYRDNFVPTEELERPYVIVSAEVLVAETSSDASHLGRGYAQWVHSIRSGGGAIAYPEPESADDDLSSTQRPMVRDRVDTRFIGSPSQVIDRLAVLQRATGADELLISTTAHSPDARERSFELLAEAWYGAGS